MLRRGHTSGARSRVLRVRSIGLEARPWRCDESDQAGCREASGLHEGPRRLLTASEPPRIAHEDQRELFAADRKSTRLNSSHSQISYAVFCLKKKKKKQNNNIIDRQPTHTITNLTIADRQVHLML